MRLRVCVCGFGGFCFVCCTLCFARSYIYTLLLLMMMMMMMMVMLLMLNMRFVCERAKIIFKY